MKFLERVNKLQTELNAPKNQEVSYGRTKYSYRSMEDINEAIKPLLSKYKLILTVSDDLVQVGERYYIKATATIHDVESSEKISATAFARESESKGNMDDSQLTGATSSYARKYAVGGLLAIDDNKDPDTDAYREAQNRAGSKAKAKPKTNMQQRDPSLIDLNKAREIYKVWASGEEAKAMVEGIGLAHNVEIDSKGANIQKLPKEATKTFDEAYKIHLTL